MKLRNYQPDDFKEVLSLFKETVQKINCKEYTQEQIDAWIQIDTVQFKEKVDMHKSYVVIDQDKIVGFGDIDSFGYLDHLYVAADYQRMGIATLLTSRLEKEVTGPVYTDASITARPFFEHRKYKVITDQIVVKKGVKLKNFKMVLMRNPEK